jgi:hypothetical protein
MIIDSTFKEELDQYELPYKESLCGLGLVVSPDTLDQLKEKICGHKS